MKIFLIVIPSISYGERQHAIAMINQLKSTSFEPILLIDPNLEDTFKNINVKKYVFYNSFDFDLLYKKENPDMFIFFEYPNCPIKIKMLIDTYKKPIVSTLGSGVGDIEPYKQNYPNLIYNESKFNLTLIKPCPVASPEKDTEFVRHWSLFKDLDTSKYNRDFINKKFNLRPDSKIVFLSVATWICDRLKEINLLHFYEYFFYLIFKALENINEKTDFFIISPFGEKYVERGNIQLRMIPFIDYETYDSLLMNSNLVVSENVMQASMSKAFVGGLNCLALINSKMMEHPFKLGPYDVLSLGKMYDKSNKYYNALDKAEISDLNDVTQKITDAFKNSTNELRTSYLKELECLDSLEKILTDIMNNIRING